MAKSEQRFGCNVCNKTWTGIALEHCRVCHETFNNTRAGDKHRVVSRSYTAVSLNNQILRVYAGERVPSSSTVLSEGNDERVCLTSPEMIEKGMRQEKNGCWNSGGTWSPTIYRH